VTYLRFQRLAQLLKFLIAICFFPEALEFPLPRLLFLDWDLDVRSKVEKLEIRSSPKLVALPAMKWEDLFTASEH
jgi:hypothetical protein